MTTKSFSTQNLPTSRSCPPLQHLPLSPRVSIISGSGSGMLKFPQSQVGAWPICNNIIPTKSNLRSKHVDINTLFFVGVKLKPLFTL